MAALFRRRSPALQLYRSYSTAQAAPDVRTELTAAVKAAMKASKNFISFVWEIDSRLQSKDVVAATTLRAVLAEVHSADKAANDEKVPSSTIISILRKAAARRSDAAAQFTAAARPDLAEKEILEVNLLSQFLPPLLSEVDVDNHLKKILGGHPSPQKPGIIFKKFYSVVDRSTVDPKMVKKRVERLLD
ncbi:Yqey-like protein-domain-containing protein [Mycena maculata]|uniref:Altered inheritance of mitochondria protein 41 n=1 Tax=Mycena maculata TaxID=230809 RepID=A0AAD7NDX4_9AGAR|nr:Yqey-like protein-domain-containing protein [Mycena maculata]